MEDKGVVLFCCSVVVYIARAVLPNRTAYDDKMFYNLHYPVRISNCVVVGYLKYGWCPRN